MMYLGSDPVAVSTGSGGVGTDTKNTAGATDTSDKLFIVGAKTQDESPQTYTQDTAYVGTDGCLYSNGAKVLTSHQDISGKAPLASPTFTGVPAAPTAATGTNTTQIATTAFVQDAVSNASGSSDIPFAVCSTSRNTAIKEVTIAGIESLYSGLRISVYFSDGNRVGASSSLKLNLNNLGAKRIVPRATGGSTSYDMDVILDQQVVDFVYHSDCWYAINRTMADVGTPGIVYLANSIYQSTGVRQVVPISLFRNWIDATEQSRIHTAVKMEHDQYICGLDTDSYRCVFRFYCVDNNGKVYYPISPDNPELFDGLFDHITLGIYGYDSSNNGTLLESQTMQWEPSYTSGVVDFTEPVENTFVYHQGFFEYTYGFSSDLANEYDHLGGVVTISQTSPDPVYTDNRLTMYHPSQDLSISLSNLTHNTIEIKNIGINVSEYLNDLWYLLWPSFFEIPDDVVKVAQNYVNEIEDNTYAGTPTVGYRFYCIDYIQPEQGGYSTGDGMTINDSDHRSYPIMAKAFLVPGDNAMYITDYVLCKKIAMTPFVGSAT